jgi:excisionase family DNA binding protein
MGSASAKADGERGGGHDIETVDFQRYTPDTIKRETFPDILNSEQAHRYLNIGLGKIKQLARQGAIPCRKAGKTWRFKRSALDRWLEGD